MNHAPSTPSYLTSNMPITANMSPTAAASAPAEPKTVRFQLITPDSPHITARLPMRVQIYPHDATDSIVTTVKNFYGLYSSPTSSKGVSFEDEAGNTMIARYENFRDNMVVYVRVSEEPALSPSAYASRGYHSPPIAADGSPNLPYVNGDAVNGSHPGYKAALTPFHLLQQHYGERISRPGSHTSRKRSISPNSARGRRSDSASTNSKNRSRSVKNRNGYATSQVDTYGPDGMNGYSSGDGAPGSSSGRIKEQQPIGNTEISVENIVEGGRRKRAKFESSELPLFAPPQMPAATSNPSVSPVRRADHRPPLPFQYPAQSPFNGAGALQSPQNYTAHYGGGYASPGSDFRRTRTSIGYSGIVGMGILPTPDPTVSSVSEEDKDVAMQLMRLGEVSNSSYGRTSMSTLDDTFSGRADAASSTGATSDSESDSEDGASDAPPQRKQRLDVDGANRNVYPSVEPADESNMFREGTPAPVPGIMAAPKTKKSQKAATGANGSTKATPKPKAKTNKAKNVTSKTKKQHGTISISTITDIPMSPASHPPSRKHSLSSNGAAPTSSSAADAAAAAIALSGMAEDDITDLSSKPRCQRCRKSKKGCDRQRPCGRCRDAGIPAELCISEDEGNGRKGRYGRHMGVPIKKETAAPVNSSSMQPPPPPSQQLPPMLSTIQPHLYQALPPPVPNQSTSHQIAQSQSQLQQAKMMPSLLPPASISSTPIMAPIIPAMMAASSDKSKKRKR